MLSKLSLLGRCLGIFARNSMSQKSLLKVVRKSLRKKKEGDICEKTTNPGKVANICEKGKGKEIEICEEVVKPDGKEVETCNNPCLESNISEKLHPNNFQGHINSFFKIMPFNQHGESSLPTEQQREKSLDTSLHSDPSSHSLTNEPEEQFYAEFIAPQNAVASSSQFSPAINYLETSHSLATEAGTSRAASNSRQNDLQGFRVTKDFITLFGKVLQILQTQPQNDISADQVQFMEDASRDLSSMNFPTEWLLPYLQKARMCLSVVERTKVISKLELEMAEIEAQLQARKENKKALEEENGTVASNMDLDKPLYDD